MDAQHFLRDGSFSVEARQASGAPADASTAHAGGALQRMARLGRKASLGVALAGGLMFSGGVAAQTSPVQQLASPVPSVGLSVSGDRQDLAEIARYALGTLDTTARNPIVQLHVAQTGAKGMQETPMALVKLSERGADCTITLDKLDETAATYLDQKEITPRTIERLRKYVIAHEAAHCDFLPKLHSKEYSSHSDGHHQVLDAVKMIGSVVQNDWNVDVPSIALGAISERQADIKAMLVYARDTIGQARSPEEMATALAEFDQVALEIHSMRKHGEAQGDHLEIHDTSSVVKATRDFVLDSAQSPTKMAKLNDMLRSNAKMNDFAEQVATASVVQDIPRITNRVIQGEIQESKKVLALMDQPGDPLGLTTKSMTEGTIGATELDESSLRELQEFRNIQNSRVQELQSVAFKAKNLIPTILDGLKSTPSVAAGMTQLSQMRIAGLGVDTPLEQVQREKLEKTQTPSVLHSPAAQVGRLLNMLMGKPSEEPTPERKRVASPH